MGWFLYYPLFGFAHRRLCPAAIFLRIAAVTVRFELLPSAAKAASMRATSLFARCHSASNRWTTPDRFVIWDFGEIISGGITRRRRCNRIAKNVAGKLPVGGDAYTLSVGRRAAMPSQLLNLRRQLAWQDYQGAVRPPNSPFAAATNMNFTVNRPSFMQGSGGFQLVDQVTVTVVFDARASWVRPEINQAIPQQQQFLLDHEQGHYDICALSARDCFIMLMSLKGMTWSDRNSGTRDFDSFFTRRHDRW